MSAANCITRATREAFAGCSTGSYRGLTRSDYYETKSSAVCAFDDELARWGLRLDFVDFAGDTGRQMIEVWTEGDAHGDCVGFAVISWYRMKSGRYEFTGYLA